MLCFLRRYCRSLMANARLMLLFLCGYCWLLHRDAKHGVSTAFIPDEYSICQRTNYQLSTANFWRNTDHFSVWFPCDNREISCDFRVILVDWCVNSVWFFFRIHTTATNSILKRSIKSRILKNLRQRGCFYFETKRTRCNSVLIFANKFSIKNRTVKR